MAQNEYAVRLAVSYTHLIKQQGSRTSGQIDPKDAGKRSNEIVAERNKMAVKQVQRYIPVSYTHLYLPY